MSEPNAGKLLTRPDESQNSDARVAISRLLPHNFWSRLHGATARVRVPHHVCYLSIPQVVKMLFIQTPNLAMWKRDLTVCHSTES
jgi:hypothetical protein